MEKALWRSEYSVGVEKFDRQHRHLFEIINKLTAQPDDSKNLKLVCQTLKEMFDFAKEHFTAEEELMQQYAYPEIESQKKQHSYFLKTTSELASYPADKKEESVEEIAEFLNVWWIIHILKWDMKYKDFFKEKLPSARNKE
ncbi:MAG: hemerythrin family protein [Sedimentisphaerales bacterium]|nr:hemerythrin family protein [Sedimentisphaerales bacterium]